MRYTRFHSNILSIVPSALFTRNSTSKRYSYRDEFSVATTHLYMKVRPSVRRSVCPSVRPIFSLRCIFDNGGGERVVRGGLAGGEEIHLMFGVT